MLCNIDLVSKYAGKTNNKMKVMTNIIRVLEMLYIFCNNLIL